MAVRVRVAQNKTLAVTVRIGTDKTFPDMNVHIRCPLVHCIATNKSCGEVAC